MDKVSVIVPVYNVKNYLEDCVNSILNQSYGSLELILVDDGSSDGSDKLCDELALLDERIRVLHKTNSGVSDTRNKGLDIARGEWVTFIDSDDIVDVHYIEYMYRAIYIAGANMAGCIIDRFEDGQKLETTENLDDDKLKSKLDIWDINEAVARSIEDGKYSANVSNKLIKRSLIEDDNPIRFDTDIYYGEDMLFFYKVLLRSNNFVGVPLFMYHYRFNEDSAISVLWNEKWDSVLLAYERQKALLTSFDKGRFDPHIAHQEACISLFLRRFTTNNPMDSAMKKRILPVIRDRWYYLLSADFIHFSTKLAGAAYCISPRFAEIFYSIFLRIRG